MRFYLLFNGGRLQCLLHLFGAVVRVSASNSYWFVSGEHRVAGGDKIKVARRMASDGQLRK
jgi:hypothetical protein